MRSTARRLPEVGDLPDSVPAFVGMTNYYTHHPPPFAMSLWKIAWRSIQHRSLASGLTAFSMGLGVALVVVVIVIYGILDQTFRRSAQGYDLIVGPKGSPLELVLATMFYSQPMTDTIPYDYFKQLSTGRYSPEVEVAIPIAIGEHFRGMPVIATTPDFFGKLQYMGTKHYSFRQGRNMDAGGDFEAVIGYTAARKTGLGVGGKFKSSHGDPMGGEEHDDEFTIVGVLAPTGTPNDQALFINIEGFFEMHAHDSGSAFDKVFSRKKEDKGVDSPPDDVHADHDHAHEGHSHESHGTHSTANRRISAVLVLTKEKETQATVSVNPRTEIPEGVNPGKLTRQIVDIAVMALPERINADLDAQAVKPVVQIARLFEKIIGNVQLVLIILAVLVVVVAGIGMMVSIYNSMAERRQEIAIMRALGARRTTVMAIILLESILLSLGGGVVGMVIGHGLLAVLGPFITEAVSIVVNPLQFQWAELILVPGLIILASVVGYLPAVIAYRTDVAQSLAP